MAVRDIVLGRDRRGLAVRGLCLALLAALLVAYAVWPRPTAFERAVGLLPAETQRVLWTDWSGVGREIGHCDDWADCEDALSDSDLGAASAIASAGAELQGAFQWGPQLVDWELLGQGPDGQVLVVGGFDGEQLESVAATYEERGFTAPGKDRLAGGVWKGTADLLAPFSITDALFTNVAFLADDGILLSSDDPEYLEKAVEAARGDGSLDFALTGSAADALAAVGLVGDRACEELGFATADPGAQAEAERLVEAAGGVSPLDGYLVALGPDRSWTAALGFEDEQRAERDLLPRQRLAAGQDPGQGEAYPDLFTVDDAGTEGHQVVLRGRAEPSAYALSQTTQGPVLLAAC